MALDDSTRSAVIAAAVTSVGPMGDLTPSDWTDKVTEQAVLIAKMTDPGSSVSKIIGAITDNKVFAAKITGLNKEVSTTRGVVDLETAPSKWHPDGKEQIRTERTDGADGAGIKMAKRIQELIGHNVLVYMFKEPDPSKPDDPKAGFRTVVRVEDLGIAA